MRFEAEQRYRAAPDVVAAAYADPALYAEFVDLPKLGAPEVVDHAHDGDTVTLAVRYRFTGHLSAAARAVIDPALLSWVEHTTHDLSTRTASYRMEPDHYVDRFESRGDYRITEHSDGGARRHIRGFVTVRALLVGKTVEGAIVSGLREHLRDEVAVVEQFVS